MNAPTGTVAAIAQTIHRHVTQLDPSPSWVHDCALYVTSLPLFQDLLSASAAVEELDRQHVEKSWGSGSTGSNCAACGGAFPCPTRITLDRRNQ